jgi:hypothetical protein
MNSERPARLEFTDCRGCGKRVATTATLCRHCNTARLPSSSSYDNEEDALDDDLAEGDSHAALGYGGYDDFALDEDTPETPKSTARLWWWVAWILIVFFVVTTLIPWL